MDPKQILSEAVARHEAGDAASAETAYRSLLTDSTTLAALSNLGVALEQRGLNDEARTLFEAAAILNPNGAAAHRRLAHHARLTRQAELAERAYRRALELDPSQDDWRTELAMVLLGTGRFGEGWPLYDRRPTRVKMLAQALSFPEWRGEPLAGKRLFVWREQGYGDQIMMARFLTGLDAAEISYAAQPGLQRLFGQLPVSFLPVDGDLVVPRHDFWVLPMSLPERLGVTLETLPTAPYLTACPSARPRGRIGLTWRGEPKNPNDRFRSLPETQALRLLREPGVVSLHPEDTGARDLQDTAEVIAGLDLVISVDTAVAHLAGALGKPVWVLLARHALDWQWMWGRPQSPWYPTARLFWQRTPGDWPALVDEVLAELPATVSA